MPTSRLGRLAVFAAVLVLVVGVAAGTGFMAADQPTETTDATVDNEYYTDESLLSEAELTPRSGEIEIGSGPSRTVAIATDGSVADLDPVVTALVEAGHEVRIVGGSGAALPPGLAVGGVRTTAPTGGSGSFVEVLDEADALLIVGNTQLNAEARDATAEFAENGGHVAVATDDASAGPDLASLTSGFGLTVGEGYLYNMAENDANFQRVYGSGAGPLDGNEFVFDRASPVSASNGTTVATVTREGTRYSVTREPGDFDVAVRSGNVMLVGDSNVFTALDYNRGDNERLVSETLSFVTDGPADPYDPDSGTDQPPQRPPQTPTQPPQEPA
jgi:hypothetical protein